MKNGELKSSAGLLLWKKDAGNGWQLAIVSSLLPTANQGLPTDLRNISKDVVL
ncbi:MAG: hypothetical protein ACUZ8O_03515 [Candidatus Anammoxibacter sp.]